MELAGLAPATSWVRSSRPLTSKVHRLQRFMGELLECRNISRNSLHRVLQRHEILDRAADAIGKERASTSMLRRGLRFESGRGACNTCKSARCVAQLGAIDPLSA